MFGTLDEFGLERFTIPEVDGRTDAYVEACVRMKGPSAQSSPSPATDGSCTYVSTPHKDGDVALPNSVASSDVRRGGRRWRLGYFGLQLPSGACR